ncbi:MAG: META domain-containing protein [Bacteroidia bacterium]|nr:META domain-containing protein [Bacteroidia bacterium]
MKHAMLLGLLSVLLLSCTPEALAPADLLGSWVAVSQEGIGKDADGNKVRLHLTFKDERLCNGQLACNSLLGSYLADEQGNLEFDHMSITTLYCGINDWERETSRSMMNTNRYEFSRGNLILSNDSLGIWIRLAPDL